jgi:hypothetical protein
MAQGLERTSEDHLRRLSPLRGVTRGQAEIGGIVLGGGGVSGTHCRRNPARCLAGFIDAAAALGDVHLTCC